jgi:hypothetical protein
MHLVVPFAAPLPEADTASGPHAALRGLALPHLRALLAGREPVLRDDGPATSLSPPHERALARARGWAAGDGLLPLAAHAALQDGIDPGKLAWGLMTPVHLHVGREQVTLDDPAALQLDETASRELMEAVRPLFESEGCLLAWGAPLRWYVAHESLATLPTASIDRVIGRALDAWLPARSEARLFKRLQNEVQMLLYTHAVTERRESAGLPTVNSFWLSGCGCLQPVRGDAVLDDRLRATALAGDMAAWRTAWQALDAGTIAELARQPGGWQLTLCGERSAVTFAQGAQRRGWWPALRARFQSADPVALLSTL